MSISIDNLNDFWRAKSEMKRVQRAQDRILKPFGLDHRHFALLMFLSASPTLNQQGLAERMGVGRNLIVDLVDELEKGHVIRRVTNLVNRRANILEITLEGQQTLARCNQALTATRGEIDLDENLRSHAANSYTGDSVDSREKREAKASAQITCYECGKAFAGSGKLSELREKAQAAGWHTAVPEWAVQKPAVRKEVWWATHPKRKTVDTCSSCFRNEVRVVQERMHSMRQKAAASRAGSAEHHSLESAS